jgi:single-stranded DNA-binding protein
MLIKLKSGMTIAAGKATEPKFRATQSGTHVCEFGIAAHKYKDEAGESHTVWVNCKAWRELADAANLRIKKGGIVFAVGLTKDASWTGNDGQFHPKEECDIDYFNVQQYGAQPFPSDTLDALMQRPGVTVQPAADPVRAAFAEFEDDDDGEFPF